MSHLKSDTGQQIPIKRLAARFKVSALMTPLWHPKLVYALRVTLSGQAGRINAPTTYGS